MTRNKVMVLLDMLMEHSELESIQIGNMKIIYNPYMNSGEWEVFCNGTTEDYEAYSDIIECAEMVLMELSDAR